MSTVQIESMSPFVRWLRAIVASLLPRAVRANYLASFDKHWDRPMRYQIQHAAWLVWGGYRVLVVPALKDGSAYAVAQAPLIVYLFHVAATSHALSWWILLPLTAMLLGLSLRDIWWYHGVNGRDRAELPPIEKYYLESSMDALCACLFMFLAQGMAWYFAWAVEVPNPVVFRASAIAVPALALLRMLLRPMPDPKSPFEGKGMPAVQMYRATCGLNILWGVCYCATVMMGMSDIPGYVPDFFRGFLPPFLLVTFVMVQRDGLEKMNFLQKLFVSAEERALSAYGRFIPQTLRPGDPFYRAAKLLEVLIFAGLLLVVEATVRPWLMGSADADVFLVVGNLLGLAVCVLTFRYVWRANQVTAQAAHEELRRLRAARGA
jgi:hypothetical protein